MNVYTNGTGTLHRAEINPGTARGPFAVLDFGAVSLHTRDVTELRDLATQVEALASKLAEAQAATEQVAS